MEMPSKIHIDSPTMKSPQQYFTSAAYRNSIHSSYDDSHNQSAAFSSVRQPSILDHASNQINGINASFKDKASQLMKDVISDVQNHQKQKPILKKPTECSDQATAPQVYRNESRVSKYGEFYVSFDFEKV